MNKNHFRFITFSVTVILLCLYFLLTIAKDGLRNDGVAYAEIEPGNSSLLFEKEGIRIYGWDSYGITYFFIPSYLELTKISYEYSSQKIYSVDGILLEHPNVGKIQDVLVGSEEKDEQIPYQIGVFKSNNLYSLYINIEGMDINDVEKDTYESVNIEILTPNGVKAFSDDNAQIKGRGNTSWEYAKKPYEIKLSKEASLLNMRKSNKWVLLANEADRTKIMNKLAFDTSSALGMEYSIEADWIDVFINGLYWGNYLLCKEPHISSDDLDIGNLQKDNQPYFTQVEPFVEENIQGFDYDNRGGNISGGYLLEVEESDFRFKRSCGFLLSPDIFINLKSPDNANREEIKYINRYIYDIDSHIRRYAEKDIHLINNIDFYSFARVYWIEEIFFNRDAQTTSYYFYKKRGKDRLYAGPCWDYDQSLYFLGDPELAYNTSITDSYSMYGDDAAGLRWNDLLLQNEEYKGYVRDVFIENSSEWNRLINTLINKYYDKIRDSVNMDYARWNVINENAGIHRGHYALPDNNVRYLKFAMCKRLNYLSEIWDTESRFSYYSDKEDVIHVISFVFADNTDKKIVFNVKDGAYILDEQIPKVIGKTKCEWINNNTDEKFYSCLPVLEDVSYFLQ